MIEIRPEKTKDQTLHKNGGQARPTDGGQAYTFDKIDGMTFYPHE